jgi:anti-sigma regulatory factor (Ser/Thr protein kinase)
MSHATADLVEFAHRAWPAHHLQLAPIHAETRRWLAPLDLSDDTEQALVRAVDEAASNVVEHAYAPVATDGATTDGARSDDVVELTFWTEGQTVCIEIVDHGHWQPPDATTRSRCSGFAIMNQLVQTVLVHYDVRGTRVLLRGTM